MFAKFLLTVAVVAFIWFGFKYVQRVTELRAGKGTPARKPEGPSATPHFKPVDGGESVQDLVKCPHCGTFRSARLGSCGQPGCPR
jgi:hypothetical protein